MELSNSAADVIAENLAEETVSVQGRKVRAVSVTLVPDQLMTIF